MAFMASAIMEFVRALYDGRAEGATCHANREDVAELFTGCDESVRQMIVSDLALADHLDTQRKTIELYLKRHARIDDPVGYERLQTVPGMGRCWRWCCGTRYTRSSASRRSVSS